MKENINMKASVGDGRKIIIQPINLPPPNPTNIKQNIKKTTIVPRSSAIKKTSGCSGCSRRKAK